MKCNQLSRLKIVAIYFLKFVIYNQAETGILYVDVKVLVELTFENNLVLNRHAIFKFYFV